MVRVVGCVKLHIGYPIMYDGLAAQLFIRCVAKLRRKVVQPKVSFNADNASWRDDGDSPQMPQTDRTSLFGRRAAQAELLLRGFMRADFWPV